MLRGTVMLTLVMAACTAAPSTGTRGDSTEAVSERDPQAGDPTLPLFTIQVNAKGTFADGNHFDPIISNVSPGISIVLKSTVSNATLHVYTFQDNKPIRVFTSGEPPYLASPDGAGYTLIQGVSGTITLSLTVELPDGSVVEVEGGNGIINVG